MEDEEESKQNTNEFGLGFVEDSKKARKDSDDDSDSEYDNAVSTKEYVTNKDE